MASANGALVNNNAQLRIECTRILQERGLVFQIVVYLLLDHSTVTKRKYFILISVVAVLLEPLFEGVVRGVRIPQTAHGSARIPQYRIKI